MSRSSARMQANQAVDPAPPVQPGAGDAGWFAGARGVRLVLLLGLLACLPGLASGLVNDDYLHRAAYAGAVPDFQRDAFSLYDFLGDDPQALAAARARGYVPWWAADDLRVRFFRPLSSATLALDIELFGDAAGPALAHNALYFLASVVLVLVILRMLLGARAAAVGACLYALAGAHAVPLAWIAARHVLVAACFGLGALALHLAARERGFRPGRWLALPVLGLGLLGSESALGAVALIACYELLGARGPVRARLLALAPAVTLALVYLAWYAAAGYGARGSGMYLHPLADPAAFLIAAATRIPALFADLLASVPSLLYSVVPAMATALPIVGLVLAGLVGGLYAAVRAQLSGDQRRHVRWLVAGSLAALVPVSGGIIGGRLLAIALLGSAALLGCVYTRVFARARALPRGRRWRLRAAALVPLLLFTTVGPLVRVGMPLVYRQVGAEQWRIARTADLGCTADSDAIFLAAADPSVASYAPAVMLLMGRQPLPRSLSVLSMAPQDHRIAARDAQTLEIEVIGPRRAHWWERVHRRTPVRAGERYQVRDMTVDVLAVERHGPSRLSVRFARPLAAPSLCFLAWRAGQIVPARVPAPGEEPMIVRFEPGPMTR